MISTHAGRVGHHSIWSWTGGANTKITLEWAYNRADFRFEPSQWETVLLCNDVSHWLGGNIELALVRYTYVTTAPIILHSDRFILVYLISFYGLSSFSMECALTIPGNFSEMQIHDDTYIPRSGLHLRGVVLCKGQWYRATNNSIIIPRYNNGIVIVIIITKRYLTPKVSTWYVQF